MPNAIYTHSFLLVVGMTMILWWNAVERLWLVPKITKATKEGLALLARIRVKSLVDDRSVKTGDLLFFRGLSWVEKTIQSYTKCRYNHVAMVVVDRGSRFLWEADVGENYRQGPRLIPLELKLSKWRGTNEVALRPIIEELPIGQVLDIAKGKLDKAFDKSMLRWLLEWWPREEECYFCSELIAETLVGVGLLEKGKRTSSYSPKDLAFGRIKGYDQLKVLK